MSDNPPSDSITSISGGVNLDGQHIDVGGDAVGRDKFTIHADTVIIGERPAPEPEDLSPAPGDPPFKGLQYFDEADADLFFGREELTAILAARLRTETFLAIIGASGSGKSSLVRAGLIPALRRDHPRWPIHVITPTAHPLKELAASLTREDGSVTATATLIDDLKASAHSLDLAVDKLLKKNNRGERLVLIVDQFEELFTACKDDCERRAFVDNLLHAVAPDTAGATTVVMTLRADFYAHCAQFDVLREALAKQQAFIGAMTADELRQAIEAPAQRNGWEFEPGLVDLLLRDAGAGDEPGALPLLSHALLATWQRRRRRTLTLAGYHESGGVRGAIAQTAETVFNRLAPDQQVIARHIFLRLTELGEGTQDTRRRATLNELITRPPLQSQVEAVLKTLVDARLVTTGQDTVEVAHEALIREWPRLRGWLDEDREGLRLHRQLAHDAQEWIALRRDEGALYRGARLDRASDWAKDHADELNPLEREFVEASVDLRLREQIQREAARQKELDDARKLAESEKQRAEEQTRSAAQLRRSAVYLIGALGIALLLGMAAGIFGVQSNQNANSRATAEANALAQRDEAQYQARIALSRQLAAQSISHVDNQFDLALLLSIESRFVDDTVEARSSLFTGLERHPGLTTLLRGHTSLVESVAFSPDGKTLASGSNDNTIILWDVSNPKSPVQLGAPLSGHRAAVWSVAFSPDDKTLASGSRDNTIILWDVSNPKSPVQLNAPLSGHSNTVESVAFSPDGKTLASGSDDMTIILWDVSNPKTPIQLGTPLTGHGEGVTSVAFNPDGKTLASGSWGKAIILWDISNRQSPVQVGAPLSGHRTAVWSVAFSPDGKTLASGSYDKTIILWDVSNRQSPVKLGAPLSGHTSLVNSVAFSPDGKMLASGSWDKTIILWDVSNRQSPVQLGAPLSGHGDSVYSVAFSPDGKTLASGSTDNTIILWDVSNRQVPVQLGASLSGHGDSVYSVAFSPAGRGKMLASGSRDKTIILWDVSNPKTPIQLGAPLSGHGDSVYSVAFSPDGKTLASGSDDKTIILWDVSNPKTPIQLGTPLTDHGEGVTSVTFSPDGQTLVSGSSDNTIILWDVSNRQSPVQVGAPLSGHIAAVNSVAFSPDGKTLASGSDDRTIILWDVSNRQLAVRLGAPLSGHGNTVTSVAFSPDGKTLASGSMDAMIILWDVSNRQSPVQLGTPLNSHVGAVYSVAFSPDGKTLASGNWDQTIILWDVSNRKSPVQLGASLSGHSVGVVSVAFSPDGEMLASGSMDKTIILWDVDVDSWRERACQIAHRNLTHAEWSRYLGDEPYRQTCEQWPAGGG